MNKTLMGAILGLLVVAVLIMLNPYIDKGVGGLPSAAIDVIGTDSGTTTTGVSFNAAATNNIYRKYIGAQVDEATLFIKTTAASSTTAYVNVKVYGSNDTSCATSTADGSGVVTGDINWFDLGQNMLNASSTWAISTATSTIAWSPTGANQGKTITLTNLNTQCLAFDVTGSSTYLYAQLRTKQK